MIPLCHSRDSGNPCSPARHSRETGNHLRRHSRASGNPGSLLTIAAAFLLLTPLTATAQRDTARLDAVIVTADRVPSSIASASAAVTRIDAPTLRRYPVRNLADALRLTPGLSFIDFDGMGLDPQIMLRGFYGGGEAEYVVLLLDGRPLNAVETGRVTWDQIPLSALQSIEIVRGGASAAWGDAALGGVINLRTRGDAETLSRLLHATIEGGSFGEMRAAVNTIGSWGGGNRSLSTFGNYATSKGFRDHAERTTGGVGANVELLHASDASVTLNTTHDWRHFDEPGPVHCGPGDCPALEGSREQSSPFYQFDRTSERTHRLGLDWRAGVGPSSRLTGQLNGEYRYSDRVRTLALTPEFADSKNRLLGTTRINATSQLALGGVFTEDSDDLLIGVDASLGNLHTRYFAFTQGGEDDYNAATPTRGDLDARGGGARTALAGFLLYGIDLAPTFHMTAGGRLDWLQDTFNAYDPSTPLETSATHVAFSPKVGMNWGYAATGHLYASFGRSFKAPTQDQLFDQRGIPVPFPPFSITFANRDLNPQFGTSYEAGIYHSATLSDNLSADLTLSAYQMDLRDELDFDIQTFRYENIGRSRHRGIESGVTLHGPRSLSLFANYTMQSATSRSGDNSGRYLKAIPKHFVSAGVSAGSAEHFQVSGTVTSAMKMFLDDANTNEMKDWVRYDLRASYVFAGTRVFADVLNVFDASYSTTGFPDPSGADIVYYYPAAGRALRLGISRDWR